ncbi:MAG: hypothetical protein J7K23_00030 [Thermoproteales archaeon]|nr:hypothetical protein [Thermoproteales archaeon]
MRTEMYRSFIKYSILFGFGILLSIYLFDTNMGLSKIIFLISLSLYALVLVGEVLANSRKVKHEDINIKYFYGGEIQSLKDELDIIEKGIRSNYIVHVLREIIYEKIKVKYDYVNFDDYEALKEIIKDDEILSLLVNKDFSISNLDKLEEMLKRIERCC